MFDGYNTMCSFMKWEVKQLRTKINYQDKHNPLRWVSTMDVPVVTFIRTPPSSISVSS